MRIIAAALVAGLAAGLSGCAALERAPADGSPCAPMTFNIYFDEWESSLNADARAVIAQVQESLSSCRIQAVSIVGLADATGDDAANLAVSQMRADTIAAALAEGGWPKETFTLAALGEKGAVADSGEARLLRRRAQVAVEALPK